MLSYAEALEKLNAMTPELHVPDGQPRRKFSLDQVRILLAALGDPQKKFPSVLIAGTNGKGSTAATLASILTASGLKTGLYTSPHLARPNERIKIKREEIADELFAKYFSQVLEAGETLVAEGGLEHLPSFFETLTAMAFLHYAAEGVQFAVLEVGMGGRLDATNVVDPLLSIITDISLDHTEWLGKTLPEIALEKAGIIRRGGTLIKLPQSEEIDRVLDGKASELEAKVIDASKFLPAEPPTGPYPIEAFGSTIKIGTPLDGAHQQRNVALAVAAALELAANHNIPVNDLSLASGVRWTYWPGRYEKMAAFRVEWILDVAHNAAGAQALLDRMMVLNKRERMPRTLIFSCLSDKPLMEMAKILFPVFELVIFVQIANPRAVSIDELRKAATKLGVNTLVAPTAGEAVRKAAEMCNDAPVVVAGSAYLVGEIRPMLVEEKLR
jgi:dihydrofolate synthase/folylpolyglutamate synthase